MEEKNITAAQRRKLFFIFSEIGIDDDARHGMVHEWTKGRTQSLNGLSFIEAQQMIRDLDEILRNPRRRETREHLDTKRKGVIRAIYAYLGNQGMRSPSMEYVKGVAVRASGLAVTGDTAHDFNRISEASLTRIYNEFCLKQNVQAVKREISFNISTN